MIEIERTFRISPGQKKRLLTKLQKIYGALERRHQVDEVYLLGTNSFKDFIEGMPVVRLRTENGITRLAYTQSMSDASDAVEFELTVGSSATMKQILTEMGYRQVVVVDRVRREVNIGEMTLALDSVKGLGDYLEMVVVIPNKSHVVAAERRLMKAAAVYALGEADIESQKYDMLLAQASTVK